MTEKQAKAFLEKRGYIVRPPEPESPYAKYLRTGNKPKIWPPLVMTREELDHFRATHGIAAAQP
jgi:hypothetical protein